MKDSLKKRIDIEIQDNRLWRAKEILQGAIGSSTYDKELYFEYAKILYRLGDHLQSGKYFLLTDTTDKKHYDAIEIFLKRHSKDECFSQFPKQFKKVKIKDYPENLQKLLTKNKCVKNQIETFHAKQNIKKEYHTNHYDDLIIQLILGLVIITFFVGIVTIFKYLWALL